jgi:hypothetical protein
MLMISLREGRTHHPIKNKCLVEPCIPPHIFFQHWITLEPGFDVLLFIPQLQIPDIVVHVLECGHSYFILQEMENTTDALRGFDVELFKARALRCAVGVQSPIRLVASKPSTFRVPFWMAGASTDMLAWILT